MTRTLIVSCTGVAYDLAGSQGTVCPPCQMRFERRMGYLRYGIIVILAWRRRHSTRSVLPEPAFG